MAKILVNSELLEELKEYMDNKADVDWEDEKQRPNHEAKLSVLLFDLLRPKSKVEPQPATKEEELNTVLDLFERFMPKNVALDNHKEMAMYEAFHRMKKLSEQPKTYTESEVREAFSEGYEAAIHHEEFSKAWDAFKKDLFPSGR
jgi:hypothetical protein